MLLPAGLLHALNALVTRQRQHVTLRPLCLSAAQLLLPGGCWPGLRPQNKLRWVCASDRHVRWRPQLPHRRCTGCWCSVTDNTPAALLLLLQSIQRILQNRAAPVTCEWRARSEGAAWCRATRPSTQPAPCGAVSLAECHRSKLLVLTKPADAAAAIPFKPLQVCGIWSACHSQHAHHQQRHQDSKPRPGEQLSDTQLRVT